MNTRASVVLFLAALLLAPLTGRLNAQSNLMEELKAQPEVISNVATSVKLWFPVGERLTYSVHWGLFHVADAVISTDWVRWTDGRPVVRIRLRTISNKFIHSIYPVNDQIDSYIDPDTFLPIRFVKDMNEGRRHELAITDFDHAAREARWRKMVRTFKDWKLPIAADTRDIPSLFYWLRKDGVASGVTNRYQVMADDKIYDLILAAEDKQESLPVPGFSPVPCFQVSPEALFEGLFVRKGKLTAWVSKGAPCLITRMDGEVPVARIRIRLAKIEGPDWQSWSNVWSAARSGAPPG
jgi:hypothetical protein